MDEENMEFQDETIRKIVAEEEKRYQEERNKQLQYIETTRNTIKALKKSLRIQTVSIIGQCVCAVGYAILLIIMLANELLF